MNLTVIEKELRALLALALRWDEQGYTPNIERDIALIRVRNIYNSMLELQCDDELRSNPRVETSPTQLPAEDHQWESEEEEVSEESEADAESALGEESEAGEAEAAEVEVEAAAAAEKVEAAAAEKAAAAEVEVEAAAAEKAAAEEHSPQQVENQEQIHRFVHDLFCNDETFYAQEMHKIGLLDSIDDVLIYIGEKYAWAPNNHTAEEFVAKISLSFDK